MVSGINLLESELFLKILKKLLLKERGIEERVVPPQYIISNLTDLLISHCTNTLIGELAETECILFVMHAH